MFNFQLTELSDKATSVALFVVGLLKAVFDFLLTHLTGK